MSHFGYATIAIFNAMLDPFVDREELYSTFIPAAASDAAMSAIDRNSTN